MWEPTGKLLIAYTMYNSTRCYGIPYTYTVVSLCDRCFSVAVRGKGIILTSTTQNKLEIKILLTVKSSMTSIHSVWEHLNLLWKSTGQRNILWEIPDQPSLRPLLSLQRDLKGLFKFRGRGIFPREFPLLIVVPVIRNNCISKRYLSCQSKQFVILLAGSKESNLSWSQPVLLVATTETRLINTTPQFICNATTFGFKSSLVFLKVRYMCLRYRRISLRVLRFSQRKTRRGESPSVWRHNAITAWLSGPVFLKNPL